MNTNVVQITQQISLLNHRHLEELHLFVEFLLNKQQKEIKSAGIIHLLTHNVSDFKKFSNWLTILPLVLTE